MKRAAGGVWRAVSIVVAALLVTLAIRRGHWRTCRDCIEEPPQSDRDDLAA